jgi:hypothetical protein
VTPLTTSQQHRAERLALDYEARRLFPTPAACRAAAEQQVREDDARAERRKAAVDTTRNLFG